MTKFLTIRALNSVILVLFITFLTFAVMNMRFTVPEINILGLQIESVEVTTGDPLADLKLNPAVSEEVIQAESERLGLGKSLLARYWIWFQNILHLDFGVTLQNQKVIDVIKPALWHTLLLNIFALLFTWLIAIPIGVLAAVKRNTWIDRMFRVLTSCLMSLPSFVFAIFMLLFALATGWFPIGGLTSSYHEELTELGKVIDVVRHLILPVFILTVMGLSGLQRQMRGNLLDVLQEDYIRTARAKGLDESTVTYKHAVRNAINPLVTIMGYEFSNLFAGSALIEMVLSYPGLGQLTLEAARSLDINLVMANLLLGSLMLVLGNLLADILLRVVDPRVTLD